jgi:hypothetical protein
VSIPLVTLGIFIFSTTAGTAIVLVQTLALPHFLLTISHFGNIFLLKIVTIDDSS